MTTLVGCASSGEAVDTDFATCDKDESGFGTPHWKATPLAALARYRQHGDHLVEKGASPHPPDQGALPEEPTYGPSFNHSTDHHWFSVDDSGNILRSITLWHTRRGSGVTRLVQCDAND